MMSVSQFNGLSEPYEKVTLQSKERRAQVRETGEQWIAKPQEHLVEQVEVEVVMEDLVVAEVKSREEEEVMEKRETIPRKKKRKRRHLLQAEAVDSMFSKLLVVRLESLSG